MAESSKRKASQVPLAPRSSNTTHQSVEYYDDDDDDENDSDEDNARALRLFIGMRGSLSVQLERYPTAPNCSCAGEDERVPALMEWTAKDRFPLEEPKIVCNGCRRSWALTPVRFRTEARARRMFDRS